jgi:hypothetical protein
MPVIQITSKEWECPEQGHFYPINHLPLLGSRKQRFGIYFSAGSALAKHELSVAAGVVITEKEFRAFRIARGQKLPQIWQSLLC